MSAAETALQHKIGALYVNHHSWLYGWLRKRLSSPHAAADLAHDTFMRILCSRDLLLGIREERAYLTTTAKRLMVDQARRHAIEQAYLAELANREEGGAASHPSPERLLMVLQALEQISRVLEGASSKARAAFVRHYLEGETQASVADGLGVSVRMVQKYLAGVLVLCAEINPD